MKSVLICGLALLLSSCTDQQDSPVPPANEDQPEELPLDANNLTLTNIKTVEPIKHKIEGVTINGTATLSDCTPSETVTVQNLPIDVKIGKDSFGNTIYFLQNN